MSPSPPQDRGERAFSAHARHLDRHAARLITEVSFEAAAIAYVEDLFELSGDGDVSVVVREVASGHEHCFRIDIGSGVTAACE